MRTLSVLLLLMALSPIPAFEAAACTSSHRDSGAYSFSPSIYVNLSGIPSAYRSTVLAGLRAWNQGVNNDGGQCPAGGFPQVTTTYEGGSQRILNAVFQSGYQPDGTSDACGEFSGSEVTFYEYARTPTGQTVPCTRADILVDTAAHEMGHALGLKDSGCGNYMMGQINYASGSYTNRTIRQAECSTLDDTHMTEQEVEESSQEDGGADDGPPGAPQESCDSPNPCSPILVDLDRGGFHLTSAAGGTDFDLDRDGSEERVAWTRAGTGDGWLAVDRNGNGRIDDGGELFGNFTDQPLAGELNGYRALAVFDDDGDGRITSADSVFEHLRLWIDADRDGTSRPAELVALATVGIEWIGLRTVENRSRDRYGNEFRYRARVGMVDGETQSVDVFLRTVP